MLEGVARLQGVGAAAMHERPRTALVVRFTYGQGALAPWHRGDWPWGVYD